MVTHREHQESTKKKIGVDGASTHAWMDRPYRYLGYRHRVLRHDPETTPLIRFLITGRIETILETQIHLKDDGELGRKRRPSKKKSVQIPSYLMDLLHDI